MNIPIPTKGVGVFSLATNLTLIMVFSVIPCFLLQYIVRVLGKYCTPLDHFYHCATNEYDVYVLNSIGGQDEMYMGLRK